MNQNAVWVFLLIATYIGLPLGMISGWMRWAERTERRTLFSILSLVGFTLATASALLAISSILYSFAIGGFPYYDPLLLRIFAWGSWLSLAGIVFAISGVWRPSSLRWHAPACALGMLVFWLMMASME